MGGSGTIPSAAVPCRPPAEVAVAADRRGDLVSASRWLAVADVTAVLSACIDRATLVLSVARQRAVAFAQSCAVADREGSDRARGLPQRRSDRQSERQNHGVRRALRL